MLKEPMHPFTVKLPPDMLHWLKKKSLAQGHGRISITMKAILERAMRRKDANIPIAEKVTR